MPSLVIMGGISVLIWIATWPCFRSHPSPGSSGRRSPRRYALILRYHRRSPGSQISGSTDLADRHARNGRNRPHASGEPHEQDQRADRHREPGDFVAVERLSEGDGPNAVSSRIIETE